VLTDDTDGAGQLSVTIAFSPAREPGGGATRVPAVFACWRRRLGTVGCMAGQPRRGNRCACSSPLSACRRHESDGWAGCAIGGCGARRVGVHPVRRGGPHWTGLLTSSRDLWCGAFYNLLLRGGFATVEEVAGHTGCRPAVTAPGRPAMVAACPPGCWATEAWAPRKMPASLGRFHGQNGSCISPACWWNRSGNATAICRA